VPNHCTNRLRVIKGDAKYIRSLVANRDDIVDFNVLVPRPPFLDFTESGSQATVGWEILGFYGVPGEVFRFGTPRSPDEAFAFAWDQLGSKAKPAERKKYVKTCVGKALSGLFCFLMTGTPSWYEWSQRYWGTKWNAYSTAPGEWTFVTAWCPPLGWCKALSHALPADAEVRLDWDEEGGGYGRITITADKVEEEE
jgi:hypothetical protein